MGVLKGDVDELIDSGVSARFMPCGLGHFIGLDTHDVGGYLPGAACSSACHGLTWPFTIVIACHGLTWPFTIVIACHCLSQWRPSYPFTPAVSLGYPERAEEFGFRNCRTARTLDEVG